MSFSSKASQRFLVPLGRRTSTKRFHHPDPFNPKMTRGWKAALAVSTKQRAAVSVSGSMKQLSRVNSSCVGERICISCELTHHNYTPPSDTHTSTLLESMIDILLVLQEAKLPRDRMEHELREGIRLGLPGASSIEDPNISTFSRGELPHFAGINTFLKAPYVEDVRDVAKFDATVVGVPFDGGCTYRAGTRFGPQGIRRISALYTPYNYEKGIDLREQMTLCDAGDVFTIPANLEKSFDQISNAIAHIASTGSFPIILGGDHSIGFPTVRGIASVTTKNIGIIHVDRHADIQEKDMDERMRELSFPLTCSSLHGMD